MKNFLEKLTLKMIKSGGNIVIVGTKNTEYVCDVNGKASKIRNGINSAVIYDIFEYYAGYGRSIGETYWDELFTNASKGNFPSKIYKVTDNSVLSAKSGSNLQHFNLIPPSRDQLSLYYEKCKEFITNTSGVASKDDVCVDVSVSKYEPEPWTGSIPPQRQVAMVDIFVNEKAREHGLSERTKSELKENIIYKIFSGELGPKIQKYGHTITSIDGLVFQNGQYWLPTDPPRVVNYNKKKTTTTAHDEENEQFVFKCSKNMSNSLKSRVNKGFAIENYQFA